MGGVGKPPGMTLKEDDIARIGRLARLHVTPDQIPTIQGELNEVMALIEQLQSIDTDGIEPLAHPLSALSDISLRLRDDTAAPTNDTQSRDHLMQNAPARQDGLFLVPRVIE